VKAGGEQVMSGSRLLVEALEGRGGEEICKYTHISFQREKEGQDGSRKWMGGRGNGREESEDEEGAEKYRKGAGGGKNARKRQKNKAEKGEIARRRKIFARKGEEAGEEKGRKFVYVHNFIVCS
jgi:hypothetical protein